MSKPRPVIEVVSARPMNQVNGAASIEAPSLSRTPTPPRQPTVIRPKPLFTADNGVVDANRNISDELLSSHAGVVKKAPPPRPQAPPKAPARAKKLARQQDIEKLKGDDGQHDVVKPAATVYPDLKECGSDAVGFINAEAPSSKVQLNRISSVPRERAPLVPPHAENDDDAYEYMEPVDSLYRPPHEEKSAGVSTQWRPVSPSLAEPVAEKKERTKSEIPPKPRRSFRMAGGDGDEPLRPLRPPPPRTTSLTQAPIQLPPRPQDDSDDDSDDETSVSIAALRSRMSTFVSSIKEASKDVRPAIPTEPTFVSYIREYVDDLYLYAPPPSGESQNRKNKVAVTVATATAAKTPKTKTDTAKTSPSASKTTSSPPRPAIPVDKQADFAWDGFASIYDDVPNEDHAKKEVNDLPPTPSPQERRRSAQSKAQPLIPSRSAPKPPPGDDIKPEPPARITDSSSMEDIWTPLKVSAESMSSSKPLEPSAPLEEQLYPPFTEEAIRPIKPRGKTVEMPSAVQDELQQILKRRSKSSSAEAEPLMFEPKQEETAEKKVTNPATPESSLPQPNSSFSENLTPSFKTPELGTLEETTKPPIIHPKPSVKPKPKPMPKPKPKPAARLSKTPNVPSVPEVSVTDETNLPSASEFLVSPLPSSPAQTLTQTSTKESSEPPFPLPPLPPRTLVHIDETVLSSTTSVTQFNKATPEIDAEIRTSSEPVPSSSESDPYIDYEPLQSDFLENDYQPLIEGEAAAVIDAVTVTKTPAAMHLERSLSIEDENVYESIKSDTTSPTESSKYRVVVVIYDFVGELADELTASAGQELQVLKEIDDQWFECRAESAGGSAVGIVPKAFVKEKSAGDGEVHHCDEAARQFEESKENSKIATAACTFDFEAENSDELGMTKGDNIIIFAFINEEWARGKREGSTQTGIFPLSFVTIDENSVALSSSTARQRAVVLFNFEAQTPEDLTLVPDEEVVIMSRLDDEWFFGENAKAETGVFPQRFVRVLD